MLQYMTEGQSEMDRDASANTSHSEILQMTTDIVSAYVSNNELAGSQIPDVIRSVFATLNSQTGGGAAAQAPLKPAVSIRRSVAPDYIICLEDVANLWALRDEQYAVMCVHHNHRPQEDTKFLGEPQTQYEKKNWSSVMLMNTAKCTALTPEHVNTKSGLELHRFHWLENENLIGEIPHKWNHLVDYDAEQPEEKIGILHFTEGGPYFDDYKDCGYANLWRREYKSMLTPAQAQ